MYTSDPDFALLHVMRLRKVAPKEYLDAAIGEDSGPRLQALAEAGVVRELTGRMNGWAMTKEGRAKHGELLAADR